MNYHNRRIFLKKIGLGSVFLITKPNRPQKTPGPQIRFKLSGSGCGRATGYAESNKIVTLGTKTHFSWLDSEGEKFLVRVQSYDSQNNSWSSTYTIGEAHDNHGGPALTCDREGYLHVVYYPHHHPMRYRKSRYPNNSSEWLDEVEFGEKTTYPTLVCGPDDTLYCSVRKSYEDQNWEARLYEKKKNGNWKFVETLLQSRYPGYAHFQESLSWSSRGLQLSGRIHEHSDSDSYGKLQTVIYMRKAASGMRWMDSAGNYLDLPATSVTTESLESGGLDAGKILRSGGHSCDRNGTAFLVYTIQRESKGVTYLAHLNKRENWIRKTLNDYLPGKYSGWSLIMPGGIAINKKGHVFVVAQLQKIGAGETSWGHKSNEVVLLRSKNKGKSFQFSLLSAFNPEICHWLPSVERNTGHHPIVSSPWCMYTAGAPGSGNSDILSNEVWAVKC